jgi:zinc/manganese transport system ATP-binding protein
MKPAVVSLRQATLRLGGRDIWKKLNLDIQPGEFIAVLGPNGSGKSSLIKTLLGLHSLRTGELAILGEPPQSARKHIGYIPQQKAFDPDTPLTGRNLVSLAITGERWFAKPATAAENKRIDEVISQVGAARYAHKPLGQLSGGEQQRLRIAQSVVAHPQLLLCDEPLLSLDLSSQQTIARLINDQRRKGTAVVFVTHEINPILPMVDRIIYLVDGKSAVGTPSEVLTTERLTHLYGAPVEVLNVHGRILVVASNEHALAEPHDAHHHHVVHEEIS